MLRELEARGVEALDCFSVDNALVRPCDPLFVGYCADRRSDCGERFIQVRKVPVHRVQPWSVFSTLCPDLAKSVTVRQYLKRLYMI